VDALRAIEGTQQQLSDHERGDLQRHSAPAKGSQRPRPEHALGLIAENENVAVKKEQLNGEGGWRSHFFQGHADCIEAGAGDENEGGADRQDETEHDRSKGNPAAGDLERTQMDENGPIQKRIEDADKEGERRGQQDLFSGGSRAAGCREPPEQRGR
jgi:hypothetical protein